MLAASELAWDSGLRHQPFAVAGDRATGRGGLCESEIGGTHALHRARHFESAAGGDKVALYNNWRSYAFARCNHRTSAVSRKAPAPEWHPSYCSSPQAGDCFVRVVPTL